MISVILYGRNDNYGYNLHKRAALSFNCIAEILDDAADEILFVDYNTPDDFPTFPEAIQDTLTDKARSLLRILRVRPSIHSRFRSQTQLFVLEPIARNIAVRRSNQNNHWVLSTNTDMIFVPLRKRTLNEIVANLSDGFYHAPRIEIPETLWESLDRQKPQETIATIREWGKTLHLNEIVLGSRIIRYDGPGDFQLMTRSDLFKVHAFDERMLLGWHVDSNIAKRLSLLHGRVGDLRKEIYGYHCDHTRQITAAHSSGTRTENNARKFVTNVTRADVPEQAETWGCINDEIEEIRLRKDSAKIYVATLAHAIGEPLDQPTFAKYTGATYDKVGYDPDHLLPFLVDLFASAPKNTTIAWYGSRLDILNMFAEVWRGLGFTGKIVVDRPLLSEAELAQCGVAIVSEQIVDAEANAFIFDFCFQASGVKLKSKKYVKEISDELRSAFLRVIQKEQHRPEQGMNLRRIVTLNTINNSYEAFVVDAVAAGLTPFSTRMRHGFVRPPVQGRTNWLPFMSVGEAGVRRYPNQASRDPVIRSAPGKFGFVAYGPYRHLFEGAYRLIVTWDEAGRNFGFFIDEPCFVIDAICGKEILAFQPVYYKDLEKGHCECRFRVPLQIANSIVGIETRVRVLRPLNIAIRAFEIERLPDDELVSDIPPFIQIDNWLPFLNRGAAARYDEGSIVVKRGTSGHIFWGPYWQLPIGFYEMVMTFDRLDGDRDRCLGVAEVVAKDRYIVARDVYLKSIVSVGAADSLDKIVIPFEIGDDEFEDRVVIETRFWSSGAVGFRIRAMQIMPREAQFMPIGSDIKSRAKYLASAFVRGPAILRHLRKLYWFIKGAFNAD